MAEERHERANAPLAISTYSPTRVDPLKFSPARSVGATEPSTTPVKSLAIPGFVEVGPEVQTSPARSSATESTITSPEDAEFTTEEELFLDTLGSLMDVRRPL